ncbi:dymeclin-like [Stylophora pistillata]|uniref:dymeclin-like n=1 Tax=Stylophora pistillata TaxID=50429 RepID=UPI000C05002A|nr:dymeclin-like [Stylophora pistillata]
MGAKPSSISDLQHNPVLQTFTGETAIGEEEEFWEDILAFSFQAPYNSADARLLEEATEPICQRLVGNNLTTRNFVTLVKVFLKRIPDLKDSTKYEDSDFTWQTYNAILLVRSFSKYFIEMLPNEDVIRHLGGSVVKSQSDEDVSGFTGQVLHCTDCGVIEDLICGLFDVIANVPVSEMTYPIHVEAINTLLVMLSVQMFDSSAFHSSIFYQVIMNGKCNSSANDLVRVLLKNFIKSDKTPAELTTVTNGGWFSGVWSWFGSQSTSEDDSSLLANQSLLLLLVLVNHCTQDKRKLNPYRHALFNFTNRKLKENTMDEDNLEKEGDPPFTLHIGMLFTAICRDLHKDQTTLLLYLLLHRNPSVASFILSRTDIDNLVMPILKLLYNADNHNAHHIYMSLIILLILSQDDNFNKSVHELVIPTIPWYTERVITNITLGGLLVLVVLRTIQYNMTKMRDKYLHTNCLATLANMSSQFHALHPYVTQRIVSLYALLSKKHAKVTELLKQAESGNEQQNANGAHNSDHLADLAILEEVIRMVLEIINSCVTNTLHHNPNLVYTLLHRRELFAQFRTHPTFQDIIQNIDTVLAFFSARLEQHPDQTLSVGVVLDVIKQGTLQWPRDRLKKFPELKFKYVEEEQPEEFFIPYVWSLVYKSSTLYWNPDHIQLFHPESDESGS